MELLLKPIIKTWMLWFLLCLISGMKNIAVADHVLDEIQLFKAAYIYNFGKLVTWPQGTWQSQESPFTLCTLGQDSVIEAIKKLSGRTIQGHPVTIQSYKKNVPVGICQILYVAQNSSHNFSANDGLYTESALLTVSEISGFIDQGGIIELYRENNRTRFKINLTIAHERGLKISSRLLNLASEVEDGKTP
jgi:hypothetical protein